MKTVSLSQAKFLFPAPEGKTVLSKENGFTQDIVFQIHSVFSQSFSQSKQLANSFNEGNTETTLNNVWNFARTQIRYVLDPEGKQLIKTPSRIVHDGFADCKCLSILINSILANLGIKHAFRYVSYSQGGAVTHVYSIAWIGSKMYILDACMPEFNTEKKPFFNYKDYMPEVYTLSGISGIDVPEVEISGLETEGEMDLKLMRETRALEGFIAGEIQGIGSPLHQKLDEAVSDYDAVLNSLSNPDRVSAIADEIGRRGKKKKGGLKKGFKALRSKVNTRRKALVKRAIKTVKSGAKALKKVLSTPQRLILRVALPKAADLFLYIFITNPKTVAALPPKVAKKRNSQIRFMKFLLLVTSLSEGNFRKIVRNGIMRKHKQTPEMILSKVVNGPISGIGFVSDAVAIVDLIQKIAKAFGKKPSKEETPEGVDLADDFKDVTSKGRRMLKADIKYRSAAQRGEEQDSLQNETAQRAEQTNILEQIEREPETTSENEELPEADSNFKTPGLDLESKGQKRGTFSSGSSASDSGNTGEEKKNSLAPLLFLLPFLI